MRLTLKISLAVLLGISLLLSLHSYFSIQRERVQLKERLGREALDLGQSLRVMLAEVWRMRGPQAAIGFLESANLVNGRLRVRWVWVDGETSGRYRPQLPPEKLSSLQGGETLSLLAESADGQDYLVTYFPLRDDRGRLGAVELSKSLEELNGYVRESLLRSAILMTSIIGSGLLLMAVLGSFWINRPVRRLAEQAQRIGTGDFSTPLAVSGRDELAVLGGTIERMRRQLAEAREAERTATRAKLDALEKLRHTERLATIGRLSAGMAHELGTPLNVISGRAKLIAGQELSPEEATRSAEIIGQQSERITAIMRQLLDFARRSTAHKRPLELGGLIDGVLELLAPTARKQAVDLQNRRPQRAVTVNADPGQLQQVLLNLAMNAMQAMPCGGRLEIRLEEAVAPPESRAAAGPWCRVQIEDEGEGIAPENLPHIFDPFFTTKEVGQGTGLGLSIAYGIIEEHGGRIEVDSIPGEGSLFSVYLPQASGGEGE